MLTLALSASGCNPFRRKKTPPATPPPPAVQKPAAAPTAPPPAPEPHVKPPVHTPEPEPPPDTRTVRLPEPAPPPAKRPKPQAQPPPAPPEPAPPAPPPPELGQMLSPQEQQHYIRLTEDALARARGLLGKLEARRLGPEQKAAYDRIVVFIRQAEQLRARDLVQAASLAQRAAVLAADLAASVR